MNETKKALTDLGNRILAASRNELYVSMRFLDIALSCLPYEMDLSMRTIGTDGFTIRYNPAYLFETYSRSEKEVNRAYLHMLLHCLFRHMYGGGDKDKELWDISCDIAVTAILDSMKYPCVSLVVPDQRNAVYDKLKRHLKVLTAEGIYRELRKNPTDYFTLQKIKTYFTVDDHVFWEAKNEEERAEPQHREKNREQQWKEIEEKMRTNIETFSRDATDLAGMLYEYVRVDTRQRYDYKSFLRKFTMRREEMKLDPENFDYIYYTFGLQMYGNMPLIEPLEYREARKVEELAIVLDTSESCSGRIVRRFLNETFSLLCDTEAFFSRMNVHIVQCDAKTQDDTVIRSREDVQKYIENFKIAGHGGTDFRPAFDYVDRLCREKAFRNLKGLLYFTDGCGLYPAHRPAYKTAFIFLDDNYYDRNVPPWAIKLILGTDDLKIKTGETDEY